MTGWRAVTDGGRAGLGTLPPASPRREETMKTELLVTGSRGMRSVRTRTQMALAAGLAAIPLASAAQADYHPITVAPTAISHLFVDQGVPKVRLFNGREFLLLNLPDDI